MKKFKRIFLAIVTLALGLSLASCKNKEVRNEEVPYGTLSLEAPIAKSGNYSLDTKTYYDLLRAKSYDTFLRELKYQLLNDEITAITNLLYNKDTLSDADKAVLSYTATAADADINYLYEKYDELVGTSLASSIYGTISLPTFNNKTAKDKKLAVAKYIENQSRKGIEVLEANIEVKENANETISVVYTKLPAEIVKEAILTQAQTLYAEKALYKIANEPEVDSVDENGEQVKVKNSYELFTKDQYESTYKSTLMTYGTYKAVVIQFNSYKEAQRIISKVEASIENPAQFYLELYNKQYGYKAVESLDDEVFTYEVNEDVNELNKISSGVNTLLTKTLEDGDYLREPRNINNKYVMAYRIATSLDNEQDLTKIDFEKIDLENTSNEAKSALNKTLNRLIIESNASSYANTALNKLIEASNVKVHDPFLEYKFDYSYSTQYTKEYKDSRNDVIFTIGEGENAFEYKVEDFFALMSKTAGQSVILDYFSLQYAYELKDQYVTEKTQDTNKETLETTIKAFKNNENTTYPAEIGKKTFLFANYGYDNEDDVIKYYYSAASALASYKKDVVNEKWAVEATNSTSEDAMNIVNLLLTSNTTEYQDIFSIDLDHILINIDDNNDGNPDNPEDFLRKYPAVKEEFENAVAKLAQAIYAETKYLVSKGNTTFEAFKYIVKQYNKGADLHTDLASFAGTDWDDYKTFNFLLTAEQLASNSDITQDSVSNFVAPFAEDVKIIAKSYSDDTEFENGQVVIVKDGKAIELDSDKKSEEENSFYSVEDITIDALTATSFGYHLLVVNEYTETSGLKTTNSDEKYYTYSYKIGENENGDDIIVEVNTKNENQTQATVNQLYVYLTQKQLGITSDLNTYVAEVLGSLYDETINAYVSTNFQTLLLIDTLNITSEDANYQNMIAKERAYYVNQVTNYGENSKFASWCADTTVFRKIK